ncbi:MAG: ATP-grasp domain-containing protein [Methylococcales symbiont of Hymedesmia sp. n. MRB-2018]|nr:MAG: ATP-grasp domain-containing protein [Methylococcales symbiont of Hymedesmia sp. n. MRB-2018]
MFNFKKILIVANSARMLAQSAKNAGLNPIVIDCFNDVDTQKITLASIKIDCLASHHLAAALTVLDKTQVINYAIYGSGFEAYPESLQHLFQKFTVLGNSLSVFSLIQEKVNFFSTLKKLNIIYPQTSFKPPQQDIAWLIKPISGEGGIGIKNYHKNTVVSGSNYWQQKIEGLAMSVLFVTDGKQIVIHGFHQQQTIVIDDNEYVFSGLVSQPTVEDKIITTISAWIGKLVPEFSLKGLNSFDFIVKGDHCYALEINARPSASMQLYTSNLLIEHIKACLTDSVLQPSEDLNDYRSYRVIFAESNYTIGDQIKWPEWVVDIPESGALINTGMPICSIIASVENARDIENDLSSKQQVINKLLVR